MLIELAIGDAYGAGFEYASETYVRRHHDLTRYVKHPRHKLTPGAYTDDTQMSLAIAEALADGGEWTRESLARRFVQVFKRDPREGYARRFQAFLEQVEDGESFLRDIVPSSDKSGAAMRATPLGLLRTHGEVIDRCRTQARITHDTVDGVDAALAAALMTHYFAFDLGPREEVGRYLVDLVGGAWDKAWVGPVGQKGWMSVRAAITAVTEHASLSGVLRACVDFTGDVDTVAAVALAAASLSRDHTNDLPTVLYDTLEDGPYGRTYLQSLERRLFDALRFSPASTTGQLP